ncbi:MAG: hypothetical protein IH953_04690 [Chloroflexi bacterium]|nr:hypothetical protein [Chloroflexota bacterium]
MVYDGDFTALGLNPQETEAIGATSVIVLNYKTTHDDFPIVVRIKSTRI